MKSYLSTLNEREKWMVIVTGVCLILYAYYMFLYAPLSNQVTQKSEQLTEKIATLQWMKKVQKQSRTTQTKEEVNDSQLLTILATQLKSNAILKFSYQLQQTSSGDIQLTFDAVPFNLLMQWLEKVNKHYVITVKQFDAERTKTPGIVRLTILISAVNK